MGEGLPIIGDGDAIIPGIGEGEPIIGLGEAIIGDGLAIIGGIGPIVIG